MSDAWQKLINEVPAVFESLTKSDPLQNPVSVEHRGKKGIYIFKDGDTIVHVGRTRNLQQRIRSHRTANHNSASLAFKLTRRQTGRYATYKPEGSRKDLLNDADFYGKFVENIEAIKKMDVFFVEVESHEMQYLVELYACLKYQLSTDEFDTT